MRRVSLFGRGQIASILLAGTAGYLLGSWNLMALRAPDPSASQTVALRFPMDWDDAVVAAPAPAAREVPAPRSAALLDQAQLALWNPQPMVPAVEQTAARVVASAATPDAAPMPTRLAALEQGRAARSSEIAPRTAASAIAPSAHEVKTVSSPPPRRRADRPGFVLNEAQIASIKARLHLTPDQEHMWPAVEAALRNLAYTHVREARRQGGSPAPIQIASADPNSQEVQDLKSAAIPLLMSFNAEQKDEVRSLAHVMGLDQLATQF